MADYSITTGPTPSTLNIRTIYDNAIQGFSDGQNAILQYSDVKMEFFVGTARTSYLPYRTNTSSYFNWWVVSGNVADGFVANMVGLAQPQFPCIGRKISDTSANEGFVADGWLAIHPQNQSFSNDTRKLSIKITPQNNKTITGYTLYYQDQSTEFNTGSIRIATGQNASQHQYERLYGANTTPPANWSYVGSYEGYAKVFSYTKTLTTPVTSADFLYVNIDDAEDAFSADAGTIKMVLNTYVPQVNTPTPLTFVNNTLTVTNDISATDLDMVSFQLPAGSIMYSFNVTSLLNANSITYSLDISGGANVSTGTITTMGFSLLGGNNLTPAINTTYILTLTSGSTNKYTIIGKMLGPGYTTIPYRNPVVLYTFDSNGINSGTGGANYNAIINGTSVIDTTNKFIGTGSMYIAGGSSQSGGTEVNSVEIGNMNLSTSAFTISFWLKMGSGITANPRLFHSFYGSGGQYVLWSNGTIHTTLTLFPASVVFTPSIAYSNNSFHHFVITYSSGVHTIYIDNSYTRIINNTLSGNFTRFRLGGALGQADPTIGPGNIDDFRFYNYAADATFVSYLYKLGSNTNIASLSSVAISDLVASGASVSQLVATGKPINDIINEGYTISQLVAGGVSITTLIASGVSINTLLANNVTISQLIDGGIPFSQIINYTQWLDLSATSNLFNQTYVNNFVDLSGSLLVRNDGKLTVGGDASFNNVTISGTKLLANDLAITSRLFVGDNVSIIGNMKVGNDLSANGQFSGNFASNLIPTTAIINYPSSGSGSTVITGNVRIAGDVSFNGTTVDLSTNTVLQVDDYITFNDGSTMNSFDDLKSRMFDMSASLVTTTTVACVAQERQRILCSSDGKYVAFNTTTGIDISQDYGATFTRKYLTDPANQMPSVSVCSNLSISLTGQYMICSCYGEAGEVSDYILVGFSNDYGTTWSTAYLKLLIGSFPAEALFMTGVAISSDGATMIMDVTRSSMRHLYKTTSKSLSGFTLISSRPELFAENTLKLVQAGGVEYIIAQLLESNSPGRLVIYNLSGTLIHTSAINYGGSTDISVPFNAINCILTGPNGQINQVDCREDFVYNQPNVTDISTIYSPATTRMSSAQSPMGKHILLGPFVASGTFVNSRYNCPDIKDATKLRYSTNGGYRFKQVSGLVSTTFTSVTSMALSDRGHIYIVDNIGSGQVKYVAATFELMRNVTFKKVDVIGAANVTGSVTTSSDYRIKENVSNLNNNDTIDHLVPIQYNNILSGKHEFGLLAHELQSIYPEFVEGEKDGAEYQRVDYNGLIGVLVKEVQDLKKRVALLNK